MMIDEAIEIINRNTDYQEFVPKYQLVEWLEELKELRTCVNSSAFNEGYNKIVEELEMEMKASSGYSAERVSAFGRAIEIVKGGGDNE